MSIERQQLAVADKLHEIREGAGYRTGKDFAARIGGVAAKVSRIENGRTVPSDADVIACFEAAGVEPDVIAAVRDDV